MDVEIQHLVTLFGFQMRSGEFILILGPDSAGLANNDRHLRRQLDWTAEIQRARRLPLRLTQTQWLTSARGEVATNRVIETWGCDAG